REMMLIKIQAEGEHRAEAHRMVEIYRGRVIDVTDSTYTVELTGQGPKLDAFIEAVSGMNIVEVVRSGPAAIARGARGLTV
ncbi:MAG: acetolactate synthase small subunit, partial [Gammaproteobacteria bacterium]